MAIRKASFEIEYEKNPKTIETIKDSHHLIVNAISEVCCENYEIQVRGARSIEVAVFYDSDKDETLNLAILTLAICSQVLTKEYAHLIERQTSKLKEQDGRIVKLSN